MPPAARTSDPTSHPGVLPGPGAVNVLVNGLPAARAGDLHLCLLPPPAGPHPATPIAAGSATVLVAGLPAARQGDSAGCGAVIVGGSVDVWIG